MYLVWSLRSSHSLIALSISMLKNLRITNKAESEQKGFRKNRKKDMSSEKQTWIVVKMIPWSELEMGWSESEESWKGWEVIEWIIVALSKRVGLEWDMRYLGGIGRMLLVGWLCDMWEWDNRTKQQNRNNDGWILSYLRCVVSAQRRKKVVAAPTKFKNWIQSHTLLPKPKNAKIIPQL